MNWKQELRHMLMNPAEGLNLGRLRELADMALDKLEKFEQEALTEKLSKEGHLRIIDGQVIGSVWYDNVHDCWFHSLSNAPFEGEESAEAGLIERWANNVE